MAPVIYILVIILSAGLGFFSYPMLFKNYEPYANVSQDIIVKGPDGAETISVALDSLTAEELPAKVKLLEDLPVANSAGELRKLSAGYKATLLSYQKGVLEVSDSSKEFSGEINYRKTNLIAQVAEFRLYKELGIPQPDKDQDAPENAAPDNPKGKKGKGGKKNKPGKELAQKTEETVSAPATPVKEVPAPEVNETELINNEAAVVQTADPEPVASDSPSSVESNAVVLDETQLIKAMEESLNSASLSELNVSNVKTWEAGPNEVINGTDYQTGLVTYLKDTILGLQPTQAKALISNGKVVKWVYAKTGTEIE